MSKGVFRNLKWLAGLFSLAGILAFGNSGPSSSATAQEIDASTQRLIDNLGNESFEVRRDARDRIFELGAKAIPGLQKAAMDKKQQTGYSAVRLLARLLERPKVSKAAEAALKEVASGKDAVARQAAQALKESARLAGVVGDKGGLVRGGQGPVLPQFREGEFGGDRLQLKFGGGPGMISIQRSNANGVDTIRVRSGNTNTLIETDPENGITITIDNGDGKKEYKAKDLKDLQARHPDIAKMYERHTNPRAVQMRNFGFPEEMFRGFPQDMFRGMPLAEPFDDPWFQRRARPANPRLSQELKDMELLADDISDLVKTMSAKRDAEKDPGIERVKAKLSALQRSIKRAQAESVR